MTRFGKCLGILVVVFAMGACDRLVDASSDATIPDAPVVIHDITIDTKTDTTSDTTTDTTIDLPPDTTIDLTVDMTVDVTVDMTIDMTSDMTHDTTYDVMIDGGTVISKIGEGCDSNNDCSVLSPFCLAPGGRVSFCSMECNPDDPDTPLIDEDDCPAGFTCGSIDYGAMVYNYCMKNCTPSLTVNSCPESSNTTCHPVSTRFVDLTQTVCFYEACISDEECPVFSAKSCTTDLDCGAVGPDAFCYDQETCALPGKCEPSGICGIPTVGNVGGAIGDPCTSDLDCAPGGTCLEEGSSDDYSIGTSYRHGYCAQPNCTFSADLPDYACPNGSTCYNLFYGGMCFKTCDLAKAEDCRDNPTDKGGDYECHNWEIFSVANGMLPVAEDPICASAGGETCDMFDSGCLSIGNQGNPTNMACRDRFTGEEKVDPQDPQGICLDDTASGLFVP